MLRTPRRRGAGRHPGPRHRPRHPVRAHPEPGPAAGRALRRRPPRRGRARVATGAASGCRRVPLDIVECPDRRLARGRAGAGGRDHRRRRSTELTILLPRRGFAAGWRRLLHDRSADRIAAAVAQLPHVNATIVPFQLTQGWPGAAPARRRGRSRCPARPGAWPGSSDVASGPGGGHRPHRRGAVAPAGPGGGADPQRPGADPHRDAQPRDASWPTTRARSSSSSRAGAGSPGSPQGARLVASGMVGAWEGQLAILNPDYELIAGPDTELAELED